MLFQTLDKKDKCSLFYYKNKFHDNKKPELTRTWEYAGTLKNSEDIQYAKLYCNGKSLGEVCPDHLQEEWQNVRSHLQALHRATREAKLSLEEHCFYDIVPKKLLVNYCEIKNKITEYVFLKYSRPDNYEFLESLEKVLHEMGSQPMNIDASSLSNNMHAFKTRQFYKKLKNIKPYIKYNMFGTKTGRLTTNKNYFPILTLDRDHREIIKPRNDWLVEFDFNAAELRVLLGLLDKEQPQGDIHAWNVENIFKGSGSRDDAKKRVFAWLYNPESKDYLLNKAYDRDSVLQKYYNGSQVQVTTFWNRTIDSDNYHALNYIIQSTASDLFLRQMLKVHNQLKSRKSNIAFCLHDSLVMDFSEEDMHILVELKQIFSETDLGTFRVNISAGKNFGEMKKLNL